jgi:hypothetical protein
MARRAAGAVSCLVLFLAFAPATFAAPKPNPHDPQYTMGYQAGRRDERADICRKFEKHSALATTLLGKARILLIRAFCSAHF